MPSVPEWFTPEMQDLLLDGATMSIALTLVTSCFAFIFAVVITWLRLFRVGRVVAKVYVETFRNLPALVLVIFFAFALPNAFDLETRRALFFRNDLMVWLREQTNMLIPYYGLAASAAITLNTSAYLAELLRAGINTIDTNQIEAARSLGSNRQRCFFRLMLPYGVRTASPSVITRLVHHLKNTSLASFVAVPELFKAAQTAISRSFHAVDLLIIVALMYWVLAWSWAWLLRRLLPTPRPAVAG